MAGKKGGWVIWVSLILVIVLVGAIFFFYLLYNPHNEKLYVNQELKNPVSNLTMEEAVSGFDDGYIFYLLYTLKAYNLRNPPLSSDNPKISLLVENKSYYAIVQNGLIKVYPGVTSGEDIIIVTTREEIISMIKDQTYVQQSFSSGRSSIALVAGKTTLFAKGYLTLYTEATGKSVTGNIIRIYAS